MTDPERNCVNLEQELLAAIATLKVLQCYLLGDHFTLTTDKKLSTGLTAHVVMLAGQLECVLATFPFQLGPQACEVQTCCNKAADTSTEIRR